jgi:serine phosphatase RsbU (regulator of sigma subunit)
MEQDIDYRALFAATPSPCLVLTPDLIIADVNQAYLDATGRERADLIGQYIFTVFPENPADPCADGSRGMSASLHRALATGRRDTMAIQKFDIPVPGRPGVFDERYWSLMHTPILREDGTVALLLQRVEDVTAFVREHERHRSPRHPHAGRACGQEMEAQLYARARELQELNDQLRRAHARERKIALALQQAMLPAVAPTRYPDAAVRYLPAMGSLNVCGDWYDLVDLSGGRLAVAVGDVVGRGLAAAGVMGRLHSALSAAICAVEAPAQALDILGRYARCVDGALATTVVQTVIDRHARRIDYSSAGHLPPLLVSRDRTVDFLDQATDPPLGARSRHIPRPQAARDYEAGSVLALYTDGLVEHHGEDIDVGLRRLADSVGRHVALDPESLADAVLADLEVAGGGADDIAFVVVRL